MNTLLFILATIGLSQIIVDGDIFKNIKTTFKKYCKNLFNIDQPEKNWLTLNFCITLRMLYVLEVHPLSYYIIFMILFMMWLKFDEVVDCYLCTGMWCGILMSCIFLECDFIHIFGYGCIGAFSSNITAIIINLIESITLKNIRDN